MLWPFMPEKMEQLCKSLGVSLDPRVGNDILAHLDADTWDRQFILLALPPLFVKPEPMKIQEVQEKKPEKKEDVDSNTITIDDVVKVQLVVGTIEQCEEIKKSDKLYKMQINFGPLGMRQILGGVRKHFTPEELIGKQGVFVYNLQPRKMLGLESQGMMLLAENADGKLQMTTVAGPVPNGTRLR